MVQNVPVPRDDIRGDECWNRNEKSFINVAHDVSNISPHSSVSNINRYQIRNQSTATYHQQTELNEQLSTAIHTTMLNCGHDLTDFVLVYPSPDGAPGPSVLSSPGLRNYTRRIINEQVCYNFNHSVSRARDDMGLSNPDDPRGINHYDAESGHPNPWDQKLLSPSEYRIGDSKAEDSDDDRSPRSRKRARVHRFRQGLTEEHPLSSVKSQKLIIGNEADVDRFYYIRFKDMQQSSCKVMGKAFVKLVEPRKQTHHPYTGGNEKAPTWWPPTKGDNAVRHKEPDHLLKPERINLLVHILKMIVEPTERQNMTIRKLGLNVRKLEDTTMEVMSNWFNDKEHPENLPKKKYLKEIFRVAKTQERYKRGEIDGSTAISVMCGVENRGQDGSDEEEDGCNFMPDPETEGTDTLHPISITGVQSPESILTPPMLQSSDNELRLPSQSLRQNLQRTPIPVSTFDSQLYRLEPNSFQPPPPRIPTIQDPNRRPYGQSGYVSPQTPLTSSWTASPLINSPAQSSLFFSQSSNNFTYLPPQQPQPQPQVHTTHHNFEGLHIGGLTSNRGYDHTHNYGNQQSQRPGNLSPLTFPSQSQSHTPYSYSQGSNIYPSDNDVKHDQQQQQQHRQH